MNTTKIVFDFRTQSGMIPFSTTYCIFSNGQFNCASAESFEEEVEHWNELTDDERTACRNFVKDMDKKYGKNGHDYTIPIAEVVA